MSDPIRVFIDTNELQHVKRWRKLQEAVESHPEFEWCTFQDLPVDLQFVMGEKTLSVELKEPADLVQSIATGHLTHQILNLQTPGFIVCLGSVQDVFKAIPTYGPGGRRSIQQQFGIIRHFCATAGSLGYPVFFYDMSWASFVLAQVEAYFTNPSILSYIHKGSTPGEAVLCMVPGIGAKTAKKLIEHFGTLRGVVDASESELAEVTLEGKKLGKKAKAVLEVFKC